LFDAIRFKFVPASIETFAVAAAVVGTYYTLSVGRDKWLFYLRKIKRSTPKQAPQL